MGSPEQVPLFPCPVDFAAVEAVKERILGASLATNTLSNYRSNWRSFERWCWSIGAQSLPATPALVIDHAAWCIAERLRLETVYLRVKAINFMHRQSALRIPYDDSVRCFLSNARRDLAERPQGKEALTLTLLRAIAQAFRDRGKLVDVRDRAMVLLCFACGWRRSELASLDLRSIRWVPHGLTLWLGKSKTDQTGQGRLVGIFRGDFEMTCPVRALEAWLERRGRWPGALFTRCRARGYIEEARLDADGLRRAVKRGLELIGEEAQPYGAHSLRAGMITAAIEAGATETSVMMRTGQRSYRTLHRYVRPGKLFHANPLAGLL